MLVSLFGKAQDYSVSILRHATRPTRLTDFSLINGFGAATELDDAALDEVTFEDTVVDDAVTAGCVDDFNIQTLMTFS